MVERQVAAPQPAFSRSATLPSPAAPTSHVRGLGPVHHGVWESTDFLRACREHVLCFHPFRRAKGFFCDSQEVKNCCRRTLCRW